MSSSKILLPSDFTETAANALGHACTIAKKTGDSVTILHILSSTSKKLLDKVGKSLDQLDSYMEELSKEAAEKYGVACDFLIEEGNIMTDINRIAAYHEYSLMVIGTHGAVGFRQNMFGSDMLKIASKCPIPVMVIPDNCIVKEGYTKVVFPYGSHDKFENKIDATIRLARLFDSEVHIYTIDKFAAPSKMTLKNIDNARNAFEAAGVKHIMVHDKPEEFSIGYARQTVKYATSVQADFISVMATSSSDMHHISTSDKEQLINNSEGVALLMTSDY